MGRPRKKSSRKYKKENSEINNFLHNNIDTEVDQKPNSSSPNFPPLSGNKGKELISVTSCPSSALSDSEHINQEEEELYEWKKCIPYGVKFRPFLQHLIFYLQQKVYGGSIYGGIIRDIDLYKHEPWQLKNFAYDHGDGLLYFFTPLQKKYEKGAKADRETPLGFWKATQKKKGADVIMEPNIVTKTPLTYYHPKGHNAKKTQWLMNEYRLVKASNPLPQPSNQKLLDTWALCVVRYKPKNNGGGHNEGLMESNNNSDQVPNAVGANSNNLDGDSSSNPGSSTSAPHPPLHTTPNIYPNNTHHYSTSYQSFCPDDNHIPDQCTMDTLQFAMNTPNYFDPNQYALDPNGYDGHLQMGHDQYLNDQIQMFSHFKMEDTCADGHYYNSDIESNPMFSASNIINPVHENNIWVDYALENILHDPNPLDYELYPQNTTLTMNTTTTTTHHSTGSNPSFDSFAEISTENACVAGEEQIELATPMAQQLSSEDLRRPTKRRQ